MLPVEWMHGKEIRREKTKVLAATRLGKKFVTGQYEGYRQEQGVDENSSTQTFVAGDIICLITGDGRVFLSTL